MKIGGSKNDGAWYRANKFIRGLSVADRDNLAGIMKALDTSDAAFDAVTTMFAGAGVDSATAINSKDEWCIGMAANGIPRQIWAGKLSFTTYNKTGGKYVPVGQSEIHYFAVQLRKAVRNFIFACRARADIYDLDPADNPNPGQLPDAHPFLPGDKEPLH